MIFRTGAETYANRKMRYGARTSFARPASRPLSIIDDIVAQALVAAGKSCGLIGSENLAKIAQPASVRCATSPGHVGADKASSAGLANR
jgi:hypothetical protein